MTQSLFKRLLLAFAALCMLQAPAYAAPKEIDDLTSAGTLDGSERLLISQGTPGSANSRKATVAAIAELATGNSVGTRAALAAIATPTNGMVRYLIEVGYEGTFKFSTANLSAMVTADPNKCVYIAPAAASIGASGAWVRQGFDRLEIECFGGQAIPQASWAVVANHAAYDIQPALERFQTLAIAARTNYVPGLHKLKLSGRVYYSSKWEIVEPLDIEGSQFTDQGYRSTYVRGPVNSHMWVCNRHNTYNGGTVATGTYAGCDGSRFAKLFFIGAAGRVSSTGWYETIGGSTSGSAIWFRARATVEDSHAALFGGHGFYVYAFAGTGGASEGNANGVRFDRVVSAYNGGVGFYIQGSDANVVRCHNCFADHNRLGGYWELSFLGGGSVEIETQYNGVIDNSGTSRKSGIRAYNGHIYTVRYGQEAGAATNAPSGTTAHNTWWYYVSSASSAGLGTWTSGEAVEFSADILTAFSTTKVPFFPYVESNSYGSIQITRGTMLVNGAVGLPVFGEGDYINSSNSGVEGKAFVATQDNVNSTIIGSRDNADMALRITYGNGSNAFMAYRSGSNYLVHGFGAIGGSSAALGGSYLLTLPTHSTHPNTLVPNQLGLPLWPNFNDWRRFGYISTSSDLNSVALTRGDLFFYASPSVGGKLGVVVTTTGTGGSTAVLSEFGDVGTRAPETVSGTSYTNVLADCGAYKRFTNGSASTLTIAPNSSVAAPIGCEIDFEQAGAGTVTVVAGSGVTINSRGGVMATAGQYGGGALKKTDTNTWTLTGDLSFLVFALRRRRRRRAANDNDALKLAA